MEKEASVILAAVGRIAVTPGMPLFLCLNGKIAYRGERSGTSGGSQVGSERNCVFAFCILSENGYRVRAFFHINKIR